MTSVLVPTGTSVQVAPPAIPTVAAAPPAPASQVIIPTPGIRGPTGQAGEHATVVGEILTSTQNFTDYVTYSEFVPGTTAVYRNGVRQARGPHYTELGSTTITFSDPPLVDDILLVDYQIA